MGEQRDPAGRHAPVHQGKELVRVRCAVQMLRCVACPWGRGWPLHGVGASRQYHFLQTTTEKRSAAVPQRGVRFKPSARC